MKCPTCLGNIHEGAGVCPACGTPLSPQPTPVLAPGVLLAQRFRLVEFIGRGGIGNVWLAEDTQLDDVLVACKVLREELSENRCALADMKREVLLARRLRHPHILAVYTFWSTDNLRFVTMDYAEGRSLADALADRGRPFPLNEVLPWIRQLSEALDYAHDQGVLHRDIKPANILLGEDQMVRLADFGIARVAQDARAQMTGEMTGGTLMFMSPEQLVGGHTDRRSDLYSLASSLYELLNGSPPFCGESLVTQIQLKPAPPIAQVSNGVNLAVLRALSKNPENRQGSCGAFFAELAAAVNVEDSWIRGPMETAQAPDRSAVLRRSDPEKDTARLLAQVDVGWQKRLGALMVQAGAVSEAQVEQALAEQKETPDRLGTILIRLGYTDETTVARVVATQLRIPFVALGDEQFDPGAPSRIPKEVAERLACIPVRRERGQLVVAMADPLDLDAINEIEQLVGEQISVRVALPSDVTKAIRRMYGK